MLGFEYAGPVIYGYTRWIESVAIRERLNHLLFVARDGYTIQTQYNYTSIPIIFYVFKLLCRFWFCKFRV